MTSGRPRCSAEALARDEPLFATASLVTAWLVIEQAGAWGPDALTDSKFPVDLAIELQRRAFGVRILLIRHRSRRGGVPVFFTAHSGGNGATPALVSAPMPDPEALLEVDFRALAAGEVGPGLPIEHPLYLVCTHGRHDICCADRGRPLYRAMSEIRPQSTWEVSHLGGDRFAGNLLVLPRGDYFGRLEPEDADSLVSRYETGRLDLAHHRGRSVQPRLVQAAEHFVRDTSSLDGFDDLVAIEYVRSGRDDAEVVFQGREGFYRARVSARVRPEAEFLTCRAEHTGHPVDYELVSLERE